MTPPRFPSCTDHNAVRGIRDLGEGREEEGRSGGEGRGERERERPPKAGSHPHIPNHKNTLVIRRPESSRSVSVLERAGHGHWCRCYILSLNSTLAVSSYHPRDIFANSVSCDR